MFYDKFVALCAQKDKFPTQVAAEVGFSTGNITHWKNGAQPHALTLRKISDYFGVEPSFFSDDEKKPDPLTDPAVKWHGVQPLGAADEKVVLLPVYGKVSAGNGDFADNEIVAYEPASERYGNGEYFFLQADGDSMEPKIHDGDLLLIYRTPSVDNGNIAVVVVDGEDGVVKRVIYDREHISLISLNPKYAPREFWHEDVLKIRVLGRVVQALTKF